MSMRATVTSLKELAGDLRRDRKGSMVTLAAVSMTVLFGFAGMGVDMAMWYAEKRNTQNIADSAAVAAAHARFAGKPLEEVEAAARVEAIRNGFEETGDNLITVSMASSTASSAVVRIQRRMPLYFLSIFMEQGPLIAAEATGGTNILGSHCVIGLDHAEPRTVEFIGSTYADVGCGVASNSSSIDSLYVSGTATLIANPAQANGDIIVAGSGQLITQLPPLPFSERVKDPFAHRLFPAAPSTCDYNGLVVGSDMTIGPVIAGGSVLICGDFTVKPNITLNMEPGIYYVQDGNVLFQGTVNGNGVTVVTTGTSPSSVGEFDIRAQSIVTLTAPTGGEYQGIVFHQDDLADLSGDNKFNGGGSLILAGAIYIPNQPLTYNGGALQDGCTVLVARIVKFSGTSYLRNTRSICDAVGLTEDELPTQEQIVLLN